MTYDKSKEQKGGLNQKDQQKGYNPQKDQQKGGFNQGRKEDDKGGQGGQGGRNY